MLLLQIMVYTFTLDFQTNLLVLQILCNSVVHFAFPCALQYVNRMTEYHLCVHKMNCCYVWWVLPWMTHFKSMSPYVFSLDITGFYPSFPAGSTSAFLNYVKAIEILRSTYFLRPSLKARLIVLISMQYFSNTKNIQRESKNNTKIPILKNTYLSI